CCYVWVMRSSVRFGLGVGAILLASGLYYVYDNPQIQIRDRSFFGTLKLERSWARGKDKQKVWYHRLVHGTTLHGKQEVVKNDDGSWSPVRDAEPLTYYHRTGPLGLVFAAIEEQKENRPIALIGLGTGTTAAYGESGQTVVFYEIDAKVISIA